MALNSAQMRAAWTEYECNRNLGLLEISFLGREPVRIIDVWEDAWRAAELTLVALDYGPAYNVGSYNCRNIAGTNSRSLHAYKLAIDVDAPSNWIQHDRRGKGCDWGRTRITEPQCLAIEAIRFNDGAQAFRSGAFFRTPDPMHQQGAASPESVASGVDWSTVEGAVGMPKVNWDQMIQALFEGRPDQFQPPGGYEYWQKLDPNSSEWETDFWPAFVRAISLT